MIEITKKWRQRYLASQDIFGMKIYTQQLLWCIPEEKTKEEQEFYDALLIIQKYVS